MTSPIVKWVGGKGRLLDKLVQYVPDSYGRYIEPFAGGAALFFRLAPKDAVLADTNKDLVNLYQQVQWDVERVIRLLADYAHIHKHGDAADMYRLTREAWNEEGREWDPVERAAAFVYLNKTCYNGLWRVNSDGKFNVPMGRYKNPTICDPEGLRAAARALVDVSIRCCDFRDAIASATAGDLVYFDPPYDKLTSTGFTKYSKGDFNRDDQRDLRDLAIDLSRRGCRVILSNADTPYIRELYATDFEIERVKCTRPINSRGDGRAAVDELIIVN